MASLGWQLPRIPLRTSVVIAQAVGLLAVVALGAIARSGLGLSDLYVWKAGSVFAAIMIVAIGYVDKFHPYPRFGPANQITTARAALVALVAGLAGEPTSPLVAAGAAIATLAVSLLDGVDGWLARRRDIASEFGARFDMEIDALLILALAVLAWQHGKAGAWVLLSGLMRYLFVALGWLLPWLGRPLPASARRQTVCVIQIAGLGIAMWPAIPPPASALVAAVALLALAYSFLIDIVWLRRARQTDDN